MWQIKRCSLSILCPSPQMMNPRLFLRWHQRNSKVFYHFCLLFKINEFVVLSTSLNKVQLYTISSSVFLPSVLLYQRSVWLTQRPDAAEPPLDAITTTMASVNHSPMEAAVATRTIMKTRKHAWEIAQVLLCVTIHFLIIRHPYKSL